MTAPLRILLCTFVLLVAPLTSASAQDGDTEALWRALKSGEAFAMMRHAIAPGTGDPANFTLGDCSTQRNLSAEGREQAEAIGARFREDGIETAAVYSSAWCRCQETASLLELGEVETLAPLNSFYQRSGRAEQTAATRSWLSAYEGPWPLVLVTHQVNISALTGQYAASGETIVAKIGPEGEVTVLGALSAQLD